MPELEREKREALTESIREHGVIVPVIVDQTGYVLDGYNRIDIASELGVDYFETVHECAPADRERLSSELNTTRRQLRGDQWKPLVDDLRACGKYSDRVIAQAVGVDHSRVSRYKSPELATGARAPVATKRTGEDGKARTVGGEWTAADRILHLLQLTTTGLTAAELSTDTVLAEFGESGSTVRHNVRNLCDRGLIEQAGKRERAVVWRAVVEEPEPTPTDSATHRKAERLVALVREPKVRGEVLAMLEDSKELRQLTALVHAVEKEDDAVRDADAKRRVDVEREELKRAQIARDQTDKTLRYWEQLIVAVDAAAEVLARYLREFDHFPPLLPANERRLNAALDALRQQQHRFETRLHPKSPRTLSDNVIDVP